MLRRDWLKATTAAAAGLLPLIRTNRARGDAKHLPGTTQRFDYAWLKGQARALAGAAYRPPSQNVPDVLRRLDWDQYQSIRARTAQALWAKDHLAFAVKFFHLGLYYEHPVRMYEVVGGQASELAYDPAAFDFGKSGLAGQNLPSDLGFAGFRILRGNDLERDIVAFLGASYFRAVGAELQYGLSARGLAVDTALGRPEEFPLFTSFWLERPATGAQALTVYALLDSPSVAGAYRFIIKPARTLVMDVDAALYPRKSIERLGIAPLTSMYQYGENDRRAMNDWRPEIHDSDGLSIWTGKGEWIWRPLSNPRVLSFNAYLDENPRGFGLLQRDRLFDHYQDDGVYYDRRPHLWVEPKASWGRGSVQLVELPTEDETIDNIVAFWNPETPTKAGEELLFAYRLYWGAKLPVAPTLAQVIATRTGLGGVPGQKRKYFSYRFVIDFSGGELASLAKNDKVEPVITASRGQIEIPAARPVEGLRGVYRTMFDVKPLDDDPRPIDLRVFLRSGGRTLTETWNYQWLPLTGAERQKAVG